MSEHFKKSSNIGVDDAIQELLIVAMETGYRYACKDKERELSIKRTELARAKIKLESQQRFIDLLEDRDRLMLLYENRYKIKEYDRIRRQAQRLLEENRELKRRNAMLWKELQ